jgi:hypothetical protein
MFSKSRKFSMNYKIPHYEWFYRSSRCS